MPILRRKPPAKVVIRWCEACSMDSHHSVGFHEAHFTSFGARRCPGRIRQVTYKLDNAR